MTCIHLVPEVAAHIDSLVAGADAAVNSKALSEIQRLSRAMHGGVPDSLDAAFAAEQLAGAILQGDMPCDDEAIQMFQEALRELQSALAAPPAPSNGSSSPASRHHAFNGIPTSLVEGFIEEGRELLDRSWRHLETRNMRELRRAVHTLKGSAAMVGMRGISTLAHAMEDLLDAIHEGDAKHSQETQDRFTRTLDAIAEALPSPGGHTSSIDAMLAEYGKTLAPAPKTPLVQPSSPPRPQQQAVSATSPIPAVAAETASAAGKHVRVNLEDLDSSLRSIGELGIVRSGWDQQLAANRRQLDELSLAIRRCQRIARRLDYEFAVYSPASSSAPWAPTFGNEREDFDALEMDRYTEFHLLSRDLLETASDLMALEAQLSTVATEFDSIRARHVKTCAELQDQILHMRTARASTLVPRLERAVQSAASALGKRVDLTFEGGETELDKGVLEALTAPLEHLIRNAVSHGMEEAAARDRAGKPQSGKILVTVSRDGSNAIFQVRDDGAGIDDSLVRQTIVRNGLATESAAASMQGKALYAFLFEPGFSTASMISHVSGRGVGLDIVQSAVESLKGSVTIDSVPGQGTSFTLRLPVAQSILRVLFVEAAGETFAIPLANVLRAGRAVVIAASERLRQVTIEEALQLPSSGSQQGRANRPAVVVDCGAEQIVLLVGKIQSIREVLVQPPSGILKKAPAVAGVTTLADGKVVLVLQPARLLRATNRRQPAGGRTTPSTTQNQQVVAPPLEILVVDDSVSVRRVVASTLRAQDWNVSTAKDGLEALEVLHAMPRLPDAILVDVEMPRMDGYDFLTALRSEPQFAAIPAIMLTSRGGDKHRQKAFEAGVNGFLVKPYRDEDLIEAIQTHTSPAPPPTQ